MAKFRRVLTSLWENEDYLSLGSAGAKLQFVYLVTNPSRTESGLYRVSKSTMYALTNSTWRDFQKLSRSPLIEWDDSKGLVWIVSAVNPTYFRPNPNIWISVKNDLRQWWPHPLALALVEKYRHHYVELMEYKP